MYVWVCLGLETIYITGLPMAAINTGPLVTWHRSPLAFLSSTGGSHWQKPTRSHRAEEPIDITHPGQLLVHRTGWRGWREGQRVILGTVHAFGLSVYLFIFCLSVMFLWLSQGSQRVSSYGSLLNNVTSVMLPPQTRSKGIKKQRKAQLLQCWILLLELSFPMSCFLTLISSSFSAI